MPLALSPLPSRSPSCVTTANFGAYELEEDTVKDLAEFSLANAIYAALVEGHAAEINSKRNAMDNASKNAGDMISNLQMQYNRGRQATIVSGAARREESEADAGCGDRPTSSSTLSPVPRRSKVRAWTLPATRRSARDGAPWATHLRLGTVEPERCARMNAFA